MKPKYAKNEQFHSNTETVVWCLAFSAGILGSTFRFVRLSEIRRTEGHVLKNFVRSCKVLENLTLPE